MALNTKQNRSSATHFLVPCFTPVVWPDGTIGQADRQTSSHAYGGILAGALVTAGDIIPFASYVEKIRRFDSYITKTKRFNSYIEQTRKFDSER